MKHTLFAAVAAISVAGAADAASIRWTLDKWVFADGGTATGSFVQDTTSLTLTSFDVTTTAATAIPSFGDALPGASYSGAGLGFAESDGLLLLSDDGTYDLLASVTLTETGGTVAVDDFLESGATLDGADGTRFSLDGATLTGEILDPAVIPLPAALPLLLAGLGGLGIAARRRKG